MLSLFAAYVLPVLSVVRASEGAAEEGGVYLMPYFIGIGALLMFIAMVTAVMSIGRGRGNL